MLDKLTPQARHAMILLIGAVLTYASNKVPVLPEDARPFATALLTILTLAWTPLTKQYGVGSDE